ncbi:MAG TPA: hypothetical protein VE486_03815 [Candidatus Baltobacteraceae bacterium]|jgi:hypothetical protein|nr:hypothetical protein [Candidatus Baltobacteraceae bacterium]
MLDDYIDWYRAGMAIAYVCIDIYSVGLWWFAVRRTHLPFFRLWLVVGIAYLLVSVLHVIITLSEEKLKWDVFGAHAYANFAHTEYVVRPFISVFGLIAATLMVRWAIRVNAREHEATKV